jgi:hypothetical protein
LALRTGTRNIPIIVKSMSPTQIVLTLPSGASGRTYNFNITNPMGTLKTTGFSQQSSATPRISFVGSSTISPNV